MCLPFHIFVVDMSLISLCLEHRLTCNTKSDEMVRRICRDIIVLESLYFDVLHANIRLFCKQRTGGLLEMKGIL